MRVVLSVLMLTFLCGGLVAPLAAQDTPVKIAVIDVQRLLTESDAGKVALENLQKLGESKQQEASENFNRRNRQVRRKSKNMTDRPELEQIDH